MNSTQGVSSQNFEKDKTVYREGPVARAIEKQTAKLPSDLFLWLAGATVAGSAILKVFELGRSRRFGKTGKSGLSHFVGLWAPTILLLGLYNKLVKVAGSDQISH